MSDLAADTEIADKDNRYKPNSEREGSIVYTSGEVEISMSDSDAWLPVEIGQIVKEGDSLRTFDDSWCEVKFSDMSVVRLQENTLLNLDSIYDENKDAPSFRGILVKGTAAAKVRKITGTESLEISTSTVACAVRGTVFLLSTENQETTIAVREGSVALIPVEIGLNERLAAATGDSAAVIEQLKASMPLLKAGMEITLGAREQNDLSLEVDKVIEILDSEKPGKNSIVSAVSGITRAMGVPEALSEENRTILEPLERDSLPVETEAGSPAQVLLTWSIQPEGAGVLINGDVSGVGTVSGIWNEGDTVSVSASHPGYKDFSADYTAVYAKNRTQTRIVLEQLPTRYFDLYAYPEGSRIIVDGTDKGAIYKGSVSWEGQSHIRIAREQFNERRIQVAYGNAPEGRLDVRLQPTIRKSLSTIPVKIVGIETMDSLTILSYEDGTLMAVDTDSGARMWRRTTSNSSNESARPKIIGNRVFFSGANEYAVTDRKTGDIIIQQSQDPETMHMFGKRVIPFGSLAVYPTASALIIFNPVDIKEIRRINLPAKSQMTPVVYDGKILTVTNDGTMRGYDGNGRPVLEIPLGADRPIGHAPVVSGSGVLFGDRAGTVYFVDLKTDSLAWKTSAGGAIQDEIQVSGGYAVVYTNHRVIILNQANGSPHIRLPFEFSAPPIATEGFLYGGLESGELVAVNITSGETVARIPVNGQVSSNGTESANIVLFGSDQGEILIVNKQDPSLLTVPPVPGAVQ